MSERIAPVKMPEGPLKPFRWHVSAGVAISLGLVSLQSGCYYVSSSGCFHSAQSPAAYGGEPIEFNIAGVPYCGRLTTTDTIVFTFVPVVPAFVANGNPYHLRLWTEGDERRVNAPQITFVSVMTLEGKVLLTADQPEDFPVDQAMPDRAAGMPIFSRNGKFGGWRRRLSTDDGWPNSRPVQVPWLSRELLLRVGYRRKLSDETLGPIETKEVPLKHYKHSGLFLLTDAMFLQVTGSF